MRRKERINIDMVEIEKYYTITEDGRVWSKVRNRWLKPQQNGYGYLHYCLSFGVPKNTWIFAHTLVAYKYIGVPPSLEHEIDHMDNDRTNNHYSNLRWLTHSENVLSSYARGRRGVWAGRSKPPFAIETLMKMADAKKKRVLFVRDGIRKVYESIGEAAEGLGTYRRKIYSSLKDNKPFAGGVLSYVEEVFTSCTI